MSADETILRIENALARLAEAGANHEQRTARLEEGFRRQEETNRRLDEILSQHEGRMRRLEEADLRFEESARLLIQLVRDQQRRVARVDEAFATLAALTERHQERLHEHADELRAAQVDSERKIAALADAHIRLSDRVESLAEKVESLAEKVDSLAEKVESLAESQAHSDRRLDALIDIVRNWRKDGESET
jgi:chromosome segregation ATPase